MPCSNVRDKTKRTANIRKYEEKILTIHTLTHRNYQWRRRKGIILPFGLFLCAILTKLGDLSNGRLSQESRSRARIFRGYHLKRQRRRSSDEGVQTYIHTKQRFNITTVVVLRKSNISSGGREGRSHLAARNFWSHLKSGMQLSRQYKCRLKKVGSGSRKTFGGPCLMRLRIAVERNLSKRVHTSIYDIFDNGSAWGNVMEKLEMGRYVFTPSEYCPTLQVVGVSHVVEVCFYLCAFAWKSSNIDRTEQTAGEAGDDFLLLSPDISRRMQWFV